MALNTDLFGAFETAHFPDGVRVVRDPYSGLRDANNQMAQEWVAEQLEYSAGRMPSAQVDYFAERLRQRLGTEQHTDLPAVSPSDPRYFFYHSFPHDGDWVYALHADHHPVKTDASQEIFNPLHLLESGVGPKAMAGLPDKDGVCSVSEPLGATDFKIVHLYDTVRQQVLPGRIRPVFDRGHLRLGTTNRLLYMGYSPEETRAYLAGDAPAELPRIYSHDIAAEDDADDRIVYANPDHIPQLGIVAGPEGPYAVPILAACHSHEPWRRSWARVRPGQEVVDLETLAPDNDRLSDVYYVDGHKALGSARLNDTTRSLVQIDLEHPDPHDWSELYRLEEGVSAPIDIEYNNGKIYLPEAKGYGLRVRVVSDEGDVIGEHPFPDGSEIYDISPGHGDEFFVRVTTPNEGNSLLRFADHGAEPEVLANFGRPHKARRSYSMYIEGRHGAQIPVMVNEPPDSGPDTPTILSVYGGFADHSTPFSDELEEWTDSGGRSITALVRGDDNGAAWVEAGRGRGKNQTIRDVADVAETLAREGLVSPGKLGILGASNGGMVAANAVLDRPELFGAATYLHPIADMPHFKQGGASISWVGEYGDPDDPDHTTHLREISPLLNTARRELPPTLVVAAADDHRVAPWHAYELTAANQDTDPLNPDILLTQVPGGHKFTGTEQQVTTSAQVLGFFADKLGLDIDSSDQV